jgi:hypothetical protein
MQVNADRSIRIKWQRVAAISTGWPPMLMSFRARIRQINRLGSKLAFTSVTFGQVCGRLSTF